MLSKPSQGGTPPALVRRRRRSIVVGATLLAFGLSVTWVELARHHRHLLTWSARALGATVYAPTGERAGGTRNAPALAARTAAEALPRAPGVQLTGGMPDGAQGTSAFDRAHPRAGVDLGGLTSASRATGDPAFEPHEPTRMGARTAAGGDRAHERGNRRGSAGYRPHPMVSRPSFSGPGVVDPNVVVRQVRTWVDQSVRQYCYQRALRDDPSLRGRVDVVMTIAAQGRVSTVDVSSSLNHTLAPASDLRACVARNLRGRALPAPQDGETHFAFGFDLSPGRS